MNDQTDDTEQEEDDPLGLSLEGFRMVFEKSEGQAQTFLDRIEARGLGLPEGLTKEVFQFAIAISFFSSFLGFVSDRVSAALFDDWMNDKISQWKQQKVKEAIISELDSSDDPDSLIAQINAMAEGLGVEVGIRFGGSPEREIDI